MNFHLHYQRSPSRITHEHHEHRAPTDDSVKLLSDMEAAARAKVMRSVPLESNAIKAVLHHMRDVNGLAELFVIQYEVNGSRHEVHVRVRHGADTMLNTQAYHDRLQQELLDALSKDIAAGILGKLTLPREAL